MEDNIQLTWNASLTAGKMDEVSQSLVISGELLDASINANNWAVDENEFDSIIKQMPSVTLRIDHGKSVRDVIGGLRPGKLDAKKVMFEAEVDDPHVQRLVNKGRLKYVSIGASADAFCSGCGKPSKPFRTCKCKGSHDIIKNIKLKEVSIITEPAYKNSEFKPISFTASIDSALAEINKNIVIPDSSSNEGGVTSKNILEERKMSTDLKKEIVEATTLKPAGTDAIVVLGEKLEAFMKRMEAVEAFVKRDEDERKKSEDEKKKDEECKKENAILTKFESLMTKLDTKLEAWPKKKAQPPEEEEPDEDEKPKEKPKETKKEAPATIVKGAKVEDANENAIVAVDTSQPAWFAEIKDYAKKHGILD